MEIICSRCGALMGYEYFYSKFGDLLCKNCYLGLSGNDTKKFFYEEPISWKLNALEEKLNRIMEHLGIK